MQTKTDYRLWRLIIELMEIIEQSRFLHHIKFMYTHTRARTHTRTQLEQYVINITHGKMPTILLNREKKSPQKKKNYDEPKKPQQQQQQYEVDWNVALDSIKINLVVVSIKRWPSHHITYACSYYSMLFIYACLCKMSDQNIHMYIFWETGESQMALNVKLHRLINIYIYNCCCCSIASDVTHGISQENVHTHCCINTSCGCTKLSAHLYYCRICTTKIKASVNWILML